MRMAGGKTSTVWEWVTVFGLAALAVIGAEMSALSQKWEDAVVYTTMVFVGVMLALRPAWGRSAFWWNLLPAFVGHVIAIMVIVSAIQTGEHGIPKAFLVVAGMIEGVFLITVLWKRTVARGIRRITTRE